MEPYRLFFALGTAAGVVGVLLWPLHFMGWVSFYPGLAHAHLMGHAFFGAYIVGFLGTAFPRLLSVFHLTFVELFLLLGLHIGLLAAYSVDAVRIGDTLFAVELSLFVCALAVRFTRRKDLPPPAFVMVGSGMLCGLAGATLAASNLDPERFYELVSLQKLLSYQGFILLPILGVSGFLIPRFFGMPSRDDFPEMVHPTPEWKRRAWMAAGVALAIVISFFLEAWGWVRPGPFVRFLVAAVFCVVELPLFRALQVRNSFAWTLRLAFLFLLSGLALVALFPGYRVGLLHMTLAGGFGLITFTVGTRVVFGHSGHLESLKGPNWWFLVVVICMSLGFLTRISGDLWPATMQSHYTYGAILWTGGVVLWLLKIVPKLFVTDPE